MNRRKAIYLGVIAAVVIWLSVGTEFFRNLWCELTCRGYRIPEDSSIFTFRVTQWNDGSGEWWSYGEDGRYYYVLTGIDSPPYYAKMRKGGEPQGFDPLDSDTWGVLNYGID